jgi:site-specific DNA recombinase
VIRLSEFDKRKPTKDQVTTSPPRQREQIEAKAAQRGSEIVGWAEDLDVSASKIHPMKRPQLKRWFDRPGEYDEVIFWRLDRFVRRTFPDFADMVSWSAEHSVSLVSATEDLDLSGPLPRLMATMFSTVAEMESLNTSVRVSETHEYLRRMKRWGGGRPPYGYMVIANPDGPGKVLAVNEETAEIAREAVRRVIAGESVNNVAADFNRRQIPGPHGGLWGDSGLRMILRDRALLGHVVYNGESVLGDDGMPIVRAEPLIDAADWAQLQAALDALSQQHQRTDTPSMLLQVAFCGLCEAPLYRWTKHNMRRLADGTKVRYGPFSYYRCKRSYNLARQRKDCDAKLINADELDAAFDEAVMAYHWTPHYEPAPPPVDDRTKDLAKVRQNMADLFAERVVRQIVRPDYAEIMAELEAKEAELASPSTDEVPAAPERVADGRTVGEVWQTLDAHGKRRYALGRGWKIYAHRNAKGELLVTFDGGDLAGDIEALQSL